MRESAGLTAMAALVIDLARAADIPELDALISHSAGSICSRYYEPDAIDAAIEHVFGVDIQLIQARCYFVARVHGRIVGCGGWSPFATLLGTDDAHDCDNHRLDPHIDDARIRAFFVSADWTRAGIGSALLDACETAARKAGFSGTRLMATLSGVPFYAARGYVATEDHVARFGGTDLRFVAMRKTLAMSRRERPPVALASLGRA